MKCKDRIEEVCSVLFISEEFKSESKFMVVGFTRLRNFMYSSFAIGDSACSAWMVDTVSHNVLLRVFNDTKGRCNGAEFFSIFRAVFLNRATNV